MRAKFLTGRGLNRDNLLEAIDLLDQLAYIMFMTTRGTAYEDKARDVSDRIGKLNQRIGVDGIAELTEIISERDRRT